jgi:hypothetical protein
MEVVYIRLDVFKNTLFLGLNTSKESIYTKKDQTKKYIRNLSIYQCFICNFKVSKKLCNDIFSLSEIMYSNPKSFMKNEKPGFSKKPGF